MHSHISDVWVIQQYQPHSLDDHISNGRPWDLDRTRGGLRLLSPHRGTDESGWHEGNADAIFKHGRLIEESRAETVVVLSSDHVYKLDFGDVIASHRKRAADVTMVTTRAPALRPAASEPCRWTATAGSPASSTNRTRPRATSSRPRSSSSRPPH
ncbi:MAG: sugar phosphate nucleotidyltransferase [Actinomycetota bacterium]